MIMARYDRDGEMHTLSVNGHAGYADKGQDIVCAGISAIVYALIGWLENNSEDTAFVSIDEKDGEAVVACEGDGMVTAVFHMAAIGIENIMNTYPDHVAIDIVGMTD